MAHLIASFPVQLKKGEIQTLRFLIKQNIPYPDTEGYGGQIRWRNGEGILPSYGNPPTGLKPSYECYLLEETPKSIPEDFNRTHLAGFQTNQSPLRFRGKNLGEVTVTLTPHYNSAKVCGFDNPTPSEQKMFSDCIYPELQKFITQHKTALYQEAIQRISENFDKKLASLEDAIETLRKESQKALDFLKNQKP